MRHIAIVGSGPAGYYTAEAAQRKWGDEVRVDIFDALPVPYGLIRTGVAPDHQSIKAVANRYEKTALTENVRFVGNVRVGADVSIGDLASLYHAIILATGAPVDRKLDLPGEELGNIFGSAEFVGWYNGHPNYANLDPDLSGRNAVVIGMGNVALDVSRILAKTAEEFAGSDIVAHALEMLAASQIERITILGRRGPHQIAMTPKELGELGHLARARPQVDPDDLPPVDDDAILEPGLRKSVTLLRSYAAGGSADKPLVIDFDLFASPLAFEGGDRVTAVTVERTVVDHGRALGTGETDQLPADLVVSCIGYQTNPIPDVPFETRAGRFANDQGRILPGLYAVGWAARGPSGTIGTNRPDGYAIIDRIEEDFASAAIPPGQRAGRAGFDHLATERELDIITFRHWKKIEEAEAAAARDGAPREKFVDIAAMIRAAQ